MPRIPAAGEISQEPSAMPDTINYDGTKQSLLIGQGYVELVEPAVWKYEVSGKQVLLQWNPRTSSIELRVRSWLVAQIMRALFMAGGFLLPAIAQIPTSL